MSKTYASRKEMMESNGWTEVATGIYSANNNTSSVQYSESKANNNNIKARLEKEFEEFKAGKKAKRMAAGSR